MGSSLLTQLLESLVLSVLLRRGKCVCYQQGVCCFGAWVALGAWESKEGLRPLGLVLSLLLILPEGKTEVERSCLG